MVGTVLLGRGRTVCDSLDTETRYPYSADDCGGCSATRNDFNAAGTAADPSRHEQSRMPVVLGALR